MSSQENNQCKLILIDPCLKIPEVGTLNYLSDLSPVKVEYYLPTYSRLSALNDLNQKIHSEEYKGCIILGSGASVNGKLSFQADLETTVQKCLDANIPLLGICYAHQLMASMFGAKVDWREPSQKKNIGIREISPQVAAQTGSFWDDLITNRFSAWVSHKEHVLEAPQNSVLIATRDDCKVEGLQFGGKRAWSFQSHPEAGADVLLRRPDYKDSKKLREALKKIESGRYILKKFISCLNS